MKEKKIHIVHIVGTPGHGGVQKLILDLASVPCFAAYKHTLVCAIGEEGSFKDRFNLEGIEIVFCPFIWPNKLPIPSYRISKWIRYRFAITFPWRLARVLKKIQADLVHTHLTSRVPLQAKAVLSFARLPWIWTIHSHYDFERKGLSYWKRTMFLIKKHSAKVVTVSAQIKEDFLERKLGGDVRPKVIRNGVNLEVFMLSGMKLRDMRTKWNIPQDALVYGTVGRLFPEKNHLLFIKAAALLIQSGVKAHFAIGGEGRSRTALEAEIVKQKMQEYFHLVGAVQDVQAFLKLLDVFVISSKIEGYCIALVEAFAVDLPCISTEVGIVSEIKSENALIVCESSVDGFMKAMKTMSFAQKREFYSKRSREIAQRFSIKHTAQEYKELYQELLIKS